MAAVLTIMSDLRDNRAPVTTELFRIVEALFTNEFYRHAEELSWDL